MFQALRGLAFQASTLVLSMTTVAAWGAEPNYDEAAVRSFTLPNVLAGPDGITRREHRLGGAGTVRLARASKTAIDLVRTTLVPPAGDGLPRGATR